MSLPKRSRKSKAQKPKSLRSAERLALEQLKALLSRYPNGPELDIDGLILDYIGRSGEKLDAVFKLNPSLYPYLFAEDPEKACDCFRWWVTPTSFCDAERVPSDSQGSCVPRRGTLRSGASQKS